MKRIFFMTLFVALTTITYGQTDDKGYEEGKLRGTERSV